MSFRPSKLNSVMKQPTFTYLGANPEDNLTSIVFFFSITTRLNDAVTPLKLLPILKNSFQNNLVTFDPDSLAVEGEIICFSSKSV